MKQTTIDIGGAPVPYLLTLGNGDALKSNSWMLALTVAETPAGLALAGRFREACYKMPKAVRWFHQGGHLPGGKVSTWNLFEFWSRDEDAIFAAALAVANGLGLEIQMGQAEQNDLASLRGAPTQD